MRIKTSISVAWEMLYSRNNPRSLRARRKSRTKNSSFIRIFTKRTSPDNCRIVGSKKVYSWRKVHIYTKSLNFLADIICSIPGISRITRGTNSHITRSDCSITLYMANPAAFLVGCNKKWDFKTAGMSLFLQGGNRFCNHVNIICIPAKNLYTTKPAFNPLKKQLRRLYPAQPNIKV